MTQSFSGGKVAGLALLVGGIGWFAWKIPKGTDEWKPFLNAGVGLMAATFGCVLLFRKIPTAEIGWIGIEEKEETTA
tara:strand:+ start:15753 stop:15983 length:231 start_codon:yes stop_codon:yes gene_type:complete